MKKVLSIILLCSAIQAANIKAEEQQMSVLPENQGVIQVFEKIVEQVKDEVDDDDDDVKSPEALAEFMEIMEKTKIEMKPELVTQWLKLKSDKFVLAALEMHEIAKQIEDQAMHQKFAHIAEKFFQLADEFGDLKVSPDQKITKSFKNIEQWVDIKARKMQLSAKTWELIAEQTGNEYAADLAEFKGEVAQNLSDALEMA